MNKKNLREKLKKLDAYLKTLDFESVFLEESAVVAMDSLVVSLKMEGDLNLDVSCNYVEVPGTGELLQFYGQMSLDKVFENTETALMDQEIFYLLNELNNMLPMGQLTCMGNGDDEGMNRAIGLRYTMFTDLDQDAEFTKCARVLMMLMRDYEVLCSALLLILDGDSIEGALGMIREVIGE